MGVHRVRLVYFKSEIERYNNEHKAQYNWASQIFEMIHGKQIMGASAILRLTKYNNTVKQHW